MKVAFPKISSNHVMIMFVVAAVAISLQCYFASLGDEYTRYNNYVIFKQSFAHLLENKNLYLAYQSEYYDLYKYSPTFSLLMGAFYYLPDVIGVVLFNLLNIVVYIWALKRLRLPEKTLRYFLLYVMLEAGISLTSTQTNLLMVGLIILAFNFLEEDKSFWAALCIALTVYIKVFGVVAFCLWFLYPNKVRFALYSLFWMALLFILPILVVTPKELLGQYQNWAALLQQDHNASSGISFAGWMRSWFNLSLHKIGTVLVAAILFCAPLIKYKWYKYYFFRMQILASILIWMVIFNHKGESPTYIIALTGVALWYFSQKETTLNTILLWLCLIFTSFSSTDLITPAWIMNKHVEPYSLKAVFCSITWFVMIAGLLFNSPDRYLQYDKLRTAPTKRGNNIEPTA